MLKANRATMGVMVISRDFEVDEANTYAQLFYTLFKPKTIPAKLLIVLNHFDAPEDFTGSFETKVASLVDSWKKWLGWRGFAMNIVSFYASKPTGVQILFQCLDNLAASTKPSCLRDTFGTIEEIFSPTEQVFQLMWKQLEEIDVRLDTKGNDPSLWLERAVCLYEAGFVLGGTEESSKESSRKIHVAFMAAQKAAQKAPEMGLDNNFLFCIIMSHGYHQKKDYKESIEYDDKASRLAFNLNELSKYYLEAAKTRREVADKELIKQSVVAVPEPPKLNVEVADKELIKQSAVAVPEPPELNVAAQLGVSETQSSMIEAVSVNKYLINPVKRGCLYSGTLSSSLLRSSSKMSFFPFDETLFEKYDKFFLNLGCQDSTFLFPQDVTQATVDGDSMVCLVLEDVESVDCFFDSIFEEFITGKGYSVDKVASSSQEDQIQLMEEWWVYIEERFKTIIGDIIRALSVMYLRGVSCEDLKNKLFVSRVGAQGVRGRILPLLFRSERTYLDDIEDLVTLMKHVISTPSLKLIHQNHSLPCRNLHLPEELLHFFDFVDSSKVECHLDGSWSREDRFIAVSYLVNHPYFWGSAVRMNFMRKIRQLNENGVVTRLKLDQIVDPNSRRDYWFNYVNEATMVAVLTHPGVSPYTENGDIVRYINALCNHANEKTKLGQIISEEELVRKSLRVFPEVYVRLYSFFLSFEENGPFLHFLGITKIDLIRRMLISTPL